MKLVRDLAPHFDVVMLAKAGEAYGSPEIRDLSAVVDDIAGATLYLCSRAGSYVTGAILPLDGGQGVQHGMTLFKE